MKLWRIDRLAFPDKFSGYGAFKTSGRWHHRGNRAVYTSESASLAALEYLVHLDPAIIPADISLLEIEAPDDISIEKQESPADLNPSWRKIHLPTELQDFGTRWLQECRTVLLAVPSALIPTETNYIINPAHPEASRLMIVFETSFTYNPRLIKS